MAAQLQCNSFKVELYQAIHNFTPVTGDVFKLALYTSAASLSVNTTAYSATNESSGFNYTVGGFALTKVTPVLSGSTAIVTFTDLEVGSVTVTYRQALIYNSSKANRAVAVFIFDSDRVLTNGDLIFRMPPANVSSALLRGL